MLTQAGRCEMGRGLQKRSTRSRFPGPDNRSRVLASRPVLCRRATALRTNPAPPRRNGRRRRREIVPSIGSRLLLVHPRRGRESRIPRRAGSAPEEAARRSSPPPRKVAGGDEQRLLGDADAHAQRHSVGADDVAPHCPCVQELWLALRRSRRN